MPFVRLPDGTVCHVRMAHPRRRRCSVCGLQTPPLRLRECDAPKPDSDSGTCDRLMCVACSHSPAPGIDLCPDHRLEKPCPPPEHQPLI